MPYYKFKKNEILHNTMETYPEVQFDINENKVYLNNKNAESGAFVSNVGCMDVGNLSLYEINVDRPSDSLVYPFVTKEGSFESIGSVSQKDYSSTFEYGNVVSGTYPLTASLGREHFAVKATGLHHITEHLASHRLDGVHLFHQNRKLRIVVIQQIPQRLVHPFNHRGVSTVGLALGIVLIVRGEAGIGIERRVHRIMRHVQEEGLLFSDGLVDLGFRLQGQGFGEVGI